MLKKIHESMLIISFNTDNKKEKLFFTVKKKTHLQKNGRIILSYYEHQINNNLDLDSKLSMYATKAIG